MTLYRAILCACLIMPFLTAPMSAQRVNSLGTAIDFAGGIDNSGAQAGTSGSDPFPFYSINPSVSLTSQGARSLIAVNYAFGWNRMETDPKLNTYTHIASLSLRSQLSRRWDVSIGNYFSRSSDLRTTFALRGIQFNPTTQNFEFLFSPVAIQQVVQDYGSTVTLGHQISQKSSLSFEGSFTLRDYGDDLIIGLSNQRSGSASGSFSRRLTEHTSLSFGYNASYYDFDGYSDALSNVANIGLSHVLAKDTTFQWSIGGSHLKNVGTSSGAVISYVGSAGINKKIRDNNFSLSASQDNGSSNGAGSMSRSRQISLGFSRNLSRVVSIFADASAFDSRGVLDNTLDTGGVSATANVGFALAEKISLHGGAQFQRYTKPSPFAFTQKRLFFSIRYSEPALLHSR